MISLKRNRKGQLVEARGIRTRKHSRYRPNQKESFKISRSKFEDFLNCRRCFYLDRVKGLLSPSIPGWTLNETTDMLLKKEFDHCREKQIPHRIFKKNGLHNIVPYKHDSLDNWRDSLHGGLKYEPAYSNIILHGGVDDICFDLDKNELVVIEFKSQASRRPVTTEYYLKGYYRDSYKRQIDFYVYLLSGLGFEVSEIAYFYVCNANRNAPYFKGEMLFEEELIPYKWDKSWIDEQIIEMLKVLNVEHIPEFNQSCENCAYYNQRFLMENILSA